MDSFSEIVSFGLHSSLRVAHSSFVFSTRLVGILAKLAKAEPNHREIAISLREAFSQLGATYIKLGQFIASAPSLFPLEYVEEMQACLDSVRPVHFREIRSSVERELGGKLETLFHSFDETPLASASIAQVHAAVTKEGLDVVVKVQRPDVHLTLKTDMQILGILTKVLEIIAPEFKKSGLTAMFQEFQTSILQEIDFIQEAKNIEEFESYLLKAKETRARVPRVYHTLSTKKVLTMERFYGVPITDEKGLKQFTDNPRKVLSDALEIWFSSLSNQGFFHADVHAGNLMILKDGSIGFIDFGIVGRISPKIWRGLMLFTQGIGIGEPTLVAKGLVEMDSTDSGVNPTLLAKELDSVFNELESVYVHLTENEMFDESKVNRIMFDMKEIAEKNGLKIPREFALLMKQMLYFDRYVKSMAPEINLFRDSQNFVIGKT
ncbi:ABC1 kinase family protein [Leptospira jelokensis]|uniref:AarF/ABC1/UbiB kinase family protein n=1 Tax=Leptospira jelokensis TaxID=2484931 RepID=A0A4Z1A009_9LEPT|nr:AarF/UbiB family protein [Leptospira jelokensis]TGL59805.1 AarF/ABC1/UbiB kinase family protein [Leptospira jelokensis]